MTVVLCIGSRSWTDEYLIKRRLKSLPRGTLIRSGHARGADGLCERLGRGLGFEVDPMPAKWNEGGYYNVRAGHERNKAMLEKVPTPELVIAFWDGESMGTIDTLTMALKKDIVIEVIWLDGYIHRFELFDYRFEGGYSAINKSNLLNYLFDVHSFVAIEGA